MNTTLPGFVQDLYKEIHKANHTCYGVVICGQWCNLIQINKIGKPGVKQGKQRSRKIRFESCWGRLFYAGFEAVVQDLYKEFVEK